jgi:hypothetical protein
VRRLETSPDGAGSSRLCWRELRLPIRILALCRVVDFVGWASPTDASPRGRRRWAMPTLRWLTQRHAKYEPAQSFPCMSDFHACSFSSSVPGSRIVVRSSVRVRLLFRARSSPQPILTRVARAPSGAVNRPAADQSARPPAIPFPCTRQWSYPDRYGGSPRFEHRSASQNLPRDQHHTRYHTAYPGRCSRRSRRSGTRITNGITKCWNGEANSIPRRMIPDRATPSLERDCS